LIVEMIVPLRHFLHPGDVSWTEEGHRFSWHMKLRDKEGTARFFVTDRHTNAAWEIDPFTYLAPHQFDEMVSRPDMLYQFSRYVIDDLRKQGFAEIEFRVWDLQMLNGGARQLLVDHTMDLAPYSPDEIPAGWITLH
jgi:vitamin K-dependent gamma-carboxylase